jgi:hypothetical protein
MRAEGGGNLRSKPTIQVPPKLESYHWHPAHPSSQVPARRDSLRSQQLLRKLLVICTHKEGAAGQQGGAAAVEGQQDPQSARQLLDGAEQASAAGQHRRVTRRQHRQQQQQQQTRQGQVPQCTSDHAMCADLLHIVRGQCGLVLALALHALHTWCGGRAGRAALCVSQGLVPLLVPILESSLVATQQDSTVAYISSMTVILLRALVQQEAATLPAFLQAGGIESLLRIASCEQSNERSLCLALYLLNDVTRHSGDALDQALEAGAVGAVVGALRCARVERGRGGGGGVAGYEVGEESFMWTLDCLQSPHPSRMVCYTQAPRSACSHTLAWHPPITSPAGSPSLRPPNLLPCCSTAGASPPPALSSWGRLLCPRSCWACCGAGPRARGQRALQRTACRAWRARLLRTCSLHSRSWDSTCSPTSGERVGEVGGVGLPCAWGSRYPAR